ncbi:hypothetical protein K1719_010315 [Acacia pycnantha]|nr:hypothetical protein K1719_010315 [Acacia pycnantha]
MEVVQGVPWCIRWHTHARSAADGRVLRDAIRRQHGLRVPQGNYYLVDAGRQRRNLRRCGRDVGSKYKSKVPNWYDDFEAATKWKRGIEKKEAKKIQRTTKNKADATVSQKGKEPPQVDPNSAAPPKNKKQKAEQVKHGKKKVVVSESCSSDDKGWKPTPSANGSSDTKNDEEENVGVDNTKARLYKKLKRKQRENVAPEAKADYNQTKLEDYDIRDQTVEVNEKNLMAWLSVKAPQAKDTTFTGDEMDKILLEGEMGALFGKVLDDALGVLKAELQAMIEVQHISPATSPRAGLEKDGESQHVETLKSVDKPVEAEDGRSGGKSEGDTDSQEVDQEGDGGHSGREGESDSIGLEDQDDGGHRD